MSGTAPQHLRPLLNFMQFLLSPESGSGRLPHKANRVLLPRDPPADFGDDAHLPLVAPAISQSTAPPRPATPNPAPPTETQPPLTPVGQPGAERTPPLPLGKKRPRGTMTTAAQQPLACEVLTKSTHGFYYAKYVDVPLSSFGLTPLHGSEERTTRATLKRLMGARCCYLLLGTAQVISGRILDVNIRDQSAQISPDRGMNCKLGWVPVDQVYAIPDNLPEIRKLVAEHISEKINSSSSTDDDDADDNRSDKDVVGKARSIRTR